MRLILILLAGLVTGDAHAYLDPGTGSMLLQVALGGVAAIAVAVKLYWYRILAVLGIRKPAHTEDDGG
jgi:hypothetical protein